MVVMSVSALHRDTMKGNAIPDRTPDGSGTAPATALSSERRRVVLAVLHEADGPVALPELAERLAGRDADGHTGPSDEEIALLLADLRHVQLPKLAAAGLVEYLSDGRVAPGERAGDHPRRVDGSR